MHQVIFSSQQIARRIGYSENVVVKILQNIKELGSEVDRVQPSHSHMLMSRQDRTHRCISLANRKLLLPELLRVWCQLINSASQSLQFSTEMQPNPLGTVIPWLEL